MSRSKSTQKRHRLLPPHSWESHHLANKGEANKTLVIAIVAVVVLVGLVLLLFFGKQFVGKAVSFGDVEATNAAGFGATSGAVKVAEPLILPIKVNLINRKSVALAFSLKYDATNFNANCDADGVFAILDKKFKGVDENEQAYDLTFSRELSCANGVIEAEYSGLCKDAECSNAIQGKETIAELKFTPKNAGEYTFDFSDFVLIDVTDKAQPDFIVNALGVVIKVEEQDSVCGDGAFAAMEGCDDGNTLSGDGCSDVCEVEAGWSCPEPGKCLPLCKVGDSFFSTKCLCESPLTKNMKTGVCVSEEIITGAEEAACDGKDNDGDGWIDIIPGKVQVQGDKQFPQDVTAICTTDNSCGKFGNDCTKSNAWCFLTKDNPDGAVCACNEGWQNCGTGGGCDTNIKTDSKNCGGCGLVCAAGESCANGVCATEEITLPVEEAPEIIIQLTPKSGGSGPGGDSMVSVAKGITYNVKATITPNAALPANHLAIVTLNYGLEQRVIMVETKSPLVVGGTETLAFEHTVNDAAGPLEVKVSVWNTWPSSGEAWTNLVPPAEKSYTIQ